MAQRATPMNGSCLRMFAPSVELRTVPADFAPPKLGSAFILASLGNMSKNRLNATVAIERKLRKDIKVYKRSLRSALNPSSRSPKNSWRMKSDAEILDLMRKRKISRYALEKRVGDLTRATYLYKMLTLPNNKIPRTKPRYKVVKEQPKTPGAVHDDEDHADPYKDYQTAQRFERGNYMQRFDHNNIAPADQAIEHSPQSDVPDVVVDKFPDSDLYIHIPLSKRDPDEISPKHLLPHLDQINNQSGRSRPPSPQVRVRTAPQRAKKPRPDRRWERPKTQASHSNPSTSRSTSRHGRLPVRYKGFSGARILHSAPYEPWKRRDTPSQLRVSDKFPHRKKKKDATPRPKTSRSDKVANLFLAPSP